MGTRRRLLAGFRKLATIVKKRGKEQASSTEHQENHTRYGLPILHVDISLHANQWREEVDLVMNERVSEVEEQPRHVPEVLKQPRNVQKSSVNNDCWWAQQPRCLQPSIQMPQHASDVQIRPGKKPTCCGSGSFFEPPAMPQHDPLVPVVHKEHPSRDLTVTKEKLSKSPLCLVPFNRAFDTGHPTEEMTQKVVIEVIHRIGQLGQGRCRDIYAVCGVSGMAFYGFKGRPIMNISITCSWEHAMTIYKLAKAQPGFYTLPGDLQRFGVATSDGLIRRVVIRPMEDGFKQLHKIQVGPNKTSILSLAGLVDLKAYNYPRIVSHNFSKATLQFYKNDIFWLLRAIITVSLYKPEHRLTPARATHLIKDDFWRRFLWHHERNEPHLVPDLFYQAGLGIPGYNDFPKIRTAKAAGHGKAGPSNAKPAGPSNATQARNTKISQPRFVSSKWSYSGGKWGGNAASESNSREYEASHRSYMSRTPSREENLQFAIQPTPVYAESVDS